MSNIYAPSEPPRPIHSPPHSGACCCLVWRLCYNSFCFRWPCVNNCWLMLIIWLNKSIYRVHRSLRGSILTSCAPPTFSGQRISRRRLERFPKVRKDLLQQGRHLLDATGCDIHRHCATQSTQVIDVICVDCFPVRTFQIEVEKHVLPYMVMINSCMLSPRSEHLLHRSHRRSLHIAEESATLLPQSGGIDPWDWKLIENWKLMFWIRDVLAWWGTWFPTISW